MPEQCHLANKYEDIVNLQGQRHIVSPDAQHVACFIVFFCVTMLWLFAAIKDVGYIEIIQSTES